MKKNSFTYKLTSAQQQALISLLGNGTYRPLDVPHTRMAAEKDNSRIHLYNSGKCLIQGKGAEDWITFVLEPYVLKEAQIGYEDALDSTRLEAHMGIDESGKGDFFGPLVIAAAYTAQDFARRLDEIGVKDSKRISSERKMLALAAEIKNILGGRFSLVTIGPAAYNRLYTSMGNVNRILAWGHARAIENLLEKVPDCPRALADQFGPTRQIEQALMKKGRSIRLEQRPRAESDPAVAAASILARAAFVQALRRMEEQYNTPFPKGASAQVKQAAQDLIKQSGPQALAETAKCHFKTTDAVLDALHLDRSVLGEWGQATSKTIRKRFPSKTRER